MLLNFASAKNAGGGFLNGAKAQEEDLCRSSGLYLCQLEQPDYYAANRAEKSMLYTDHIIYSPRVPCFRVSGDGLLNACFYPSVITAPAPNAGVFLQREPHGAAALAAALQRRADYVLAVAKHQAQKNLVLGAWGCGVFRNPPALSASCSPFTTAARVKPCSKRLPRSFRLPDSFSLPESTRHPAPAHCPKR